jgi:hypothetical protein
VLSGMSQGSADDWPGARFVDKPFVPDDLISEINQVIGDRRP